MTGRAETTVNETAVNETAVDGTSASRIGGGA